MLAISSYRTLLRPTDCGSDFKRKVGLLDYIVDAVKFVTSSNLLLIRCQQGAQEEREGKIRSSYLGWL
jgi:hypothetical protein